MTLWINAWLVGVGVLAAGPADIGHKPQELRRYEFTQPQMGVPFKLLFYAADDSAANRAARAAFDRVKELNRLLSDYDPESELSRLSRTSGTGQAVPVSDELWYVLGRAQALSARTEGAFDVTVGPYVKLWRRARRKQQMPGGEQLEAAREAVGFRHIRMDASHQTVELARSDMQLDLGGIAKGYAADEALRVLGEHGSPRALIAASGDIAVGEPPPGREGWNVGIAPLEAKAPPSRMLVLSRTGVATSGDAWQYVEIDGTRYSHIVDPRTGLGLTGRRSVTVVAPDSTTADSLASAACVLGTERGMKLIEATCGAAAMMHVAADEGDIVYESQRMKMLPRAGN